MKSKMENPTAHLYKSTDAIPASFKPCVLAIGNFDGVHIGHRAVIQTAKEMANKLQCPLGVLVFDPHPVSYFRPDVEPFRLTSIERRAALISEAGADFTLALGFDAEMADRSAANFIDDILCTQIGVRGVVIGHDFHFGKGRDGSAVTLETAGRENGFETAIVSPVKRAQAQTPYSSTEIRAALRAGKIEDAEKWLGHKWSITGVVAQGDQRGRTIGFPTANVELNDFLRPAFGVYAVSAKILTGVLAGQTFAGVANIGMRPTVGTLLPRVEAHLFDFSGDIYGETLDIQLCAFIRPEQKFESFELLTAQIQKDSDQARGIMSTLATPTNSLQPNQ